VLDGAMHNNTYDNSNLPFPFPDALQEFSVATGGLSAEKRHASSASVNAVTKSGRTPCTATASSSSATASSTRPRARTDRTGRQEEGRRTQPQRLRRHARRQDHPRPLFSSAATSGRASARITPDNVAFVPTAAMLAGDFTAAASPRATPAARSLSRRRSRQPDRSLAFQSGGGEDHAVRDVPHSSDPCGEIRFSLPMNNNDEQYVSRVDYQWSGIIPFSAAISTRSNGGRPSLADTRNLLTLRGTPNIKKRAQTLALGDTQVFGPTSVNAFRVTWVRTATRSNQPPEKFFDTTTLGIPVYTYIPGVLSLSVTNGFTSRVDPSVGAISDNAATRCRTTTRACSDATRCRLAPTWRTRRSIR
jgi:hypothetical protein